VGSFSGTTRLAFDPPSAGQPTALNFSFTPEMDMEALSVLQLTLAGFERRSGEVNPK
jgi:hypothetical protein